MVSRLMFIGAAALVLLLVMGAIMQVAPVLAGITPTATAATPTAPAATPTAPAATPTAPAIAPTGTPTLTLPSFLPSTGGEADGLRSAGSIVVALAGALLLLLGAISLVALKSARTGSG